MKVKKCLKPSTSRHIISKSCFPLVYSQKPLNKQTGTPGSYEKCLVRNSHLFMWLNIVPHLHWVLAQVPKNILKICCLIKTARRTSNTILFHCRLFLLHPLESLLKLHPNLQGNHRIFHTLSLLLYPPTFNPITVYKHKIKRKLSLGNIFGTASNYRNDSICYIF